MSNIASDDSSETSLQSDVFGEMQKTNFFSVPGLNVGLSPKAPSECDSVRSPTSPLDFNLFCNMSSVFRFPKALSECHRKKWDCNKVGLGSLMDSLDDDGSKKHPVKPVSLSDSKTVLIGSKIRSKAPNSLASADFCEAPKSLPKHYPIFPENKLRPSNLQKGSSNVLFEIGDDPLETEPFENIQSFSLDSKRLGSEIYRLGTRKTVLETHNSRFEKESIPGSSEYDLLGLLPSSENKLAFGKKPFASKDELARPLSPEEIELSEDYTCVILHGPVPKTTHIFGDCVLECHPNEVDTGNKNNSSEATTLCPEKCCLISSPSSYPNKDFLSYCYYCKKKLEDGKDIYMYRGEKAFCSLDCRLEEISIEEKQEKSINPKTDDNGDERTCCDIEELKILIAYHEVISP